MPLDGVKNIVLVSQIPATPMSFFLPLVCGVRLIDNERQHSMPTKSGAC
jgi:hypothetical protein